ncbi:MAG: hypothetical protein K2G40_01385 [Muribaculaceae bacterium]|nr:hypothetical protein [Muribaculaceae bacterium]
MTQTLDYETIETHLGDSLRKSDNLDIHADHFFPITLLNRIFHYSEENHGTEMEGGRVIHRNFHGHDFDRWIDNLVARTRINLSDQEGNIEHIDLVDIDSMTISDNNDEVIITLPDETEYVLVDNENRPVKAEKLEDLHLSLDISHMFDRPPVDNDAEQYLGFGTLAQIVRVVCERTGLKVNDERMSPQELSERIFRHFNNELLPLIPSLWNDMEHIAHYGKPEISGL